MTFRSYHFFLAILFSSVLISSCAKLEDVSYDHYFWTPSLAVGDETIRLFVNGEEMGALINPDREISCSTDPFILEQLLVVSLSNGMHEIEVRDATGSLIKGSIIEIKVTNRSKKFGSSSNGGSGGMAVIGEDDCFSVKVTF